MQEPVISVGIISSQKIRFELHGGYIIQGRSEWLRGAYTAEIKGGKILIRGEKFSSQFDDEVLFEPDTYKDDSFKLKDVIIGVQFHWERKETEAFRGTLRIIKEGDKITAINLIRLEDYLVSVISSEMSAKSSLALLKAHAVISRSWLIAQIERSRAVKEGSESAVSTITSDNEFIRWYDREDHQHYDVCADDHCQRYQGITKIFTEAAQQAVAETRGLALMYGDTVCDARFSKSCGGISEAFENVWGNNPTPYLIPVIDYKFEPDNYDIRFTNERNAEKWIKGNPPAFCNTTDAKILAQVLLDYDQETRDFYRWKVVYKQKELSELIKAKTGHDFGDILDLIPVERGASARLIKMKITGSKKELIIGKELEIRRALSKSHLYSSAFIIEKGPEKDGVPSSFTLTGAGWGHGVGLCQIGAAVMAEKGFLFDEILLHYYRNARLKTVY
ncbi:MAG: SpoIID/LytB domain-containing protein [Ignavibacteriaceae bacterium]|nr:SpoIID/LytB domain-containing protein [Ignavibacteriaceae bacterium]